MILWEKDNHQYPPARNSAEPTTVTCLQNILVQQWHKDYQGKEPPLKIKFKANSMSPKLVVYIKALPIKAQGSIWKRRQKDYKSQK